MYGVDEQTCLDRYQNSHQKKNTRFHAYVDPSIWQQELTPSSPTSLGYIISDDCRLIVEELERARDILELVRSIISLQSSRLLISGLRSEERLALEPLGDPYGNSRKLTEAWLGRFGVRAQKLTVEDVLPALSFKHCDGIVHLPSAPTCSPVQYGAVISPKFVSAVYCQDFVHVWWKDGRLLHTQVTPLDFRLYQSRMRLCLARIRRRIQRLEMDPLGSFSVSLQDQAYILIDTSASMEVQIGKLRKIFLDILEEYFNRGLHANFVSFGSMMQPWREEIELITRENHASACRWINQLKCHGSTNVLQALDYALADSATRCIYLFSDGRPDQPPALVFSRVRGCQDVRIHTICLNSTDIEANAFLEQLARLTGGQFCSQMTGCPTSSPLPASEALQLLRRELQLGMENLQKMLDIMQTGLCLARAHERVNSPQSTEHQADNQKLRPKKKIGQRSSSSSLPQKTTHCKRSQLARNNPRLISSGRLHTAEQREREPLQPSQSLKMLRIVPTGAFVQVFHVAITGIMFSAVTVHIQRCLTVFLFKYLQTALDVEEGLGECVCHSQTNNNATEEPDATPTESPNLQRPQSALASILEKNCTCANCTLASGRHPFRPLSATAIKSPEVPSPGAASSCVPARPNSADMVFMKGSFCPLHDCVWAWDSRYVQQQQAEFPWLPSGSLPRYLPYLEKLGVSKSISATSVKTLGYHSVDEIRVTTPFHKRRKSEPPISPISAKLACKKRKGLFQPDGCADEDDPLPTCSRQKPQLAEMRRSSSFDRCFAETMNLRDFAEYGCKRKKKLGSSTPNDLRLCPPPDPNRPRSVRERELKRENEYVHTAIQKSPCGSVRAATPPPQPSEKTMDALLTRRCQTRVIAFDFEDGVFYPGLIVRCLGNESSVIRFRHNGQLFEVPNYLNLPVKDITHNQTLQNADTVLARVKNTKTCQECWVPAIVTGGFLGSPDPRVPLSWRYPVQLFSGARFPFRRRDLIKISPKFFDSLVAYIIDKNKDPCSRIAQQIRSLDNEWEPMQE